MLDRARQKVSRLAEDPAPPTWDNLLAPLDEIVHEVREGVAPVKHLLAVAQSPALRKAWDEVLPDVTRFWSGLRQDQGLWSRLNRYAATEEARALDGVRTRHLEKTLREFRRAGAALSGEERERLQELRIRLARLERKFAEHVLDANARWELHVTDPSRLDGVPARARERARARARERGVEGWILTLDYPSYEPVMKYGRDRNLRQELHSAFVSRCLGGDLDNRPLVVRILELRQEMAERLGYRDFSDLQLEEAMTGSGEEARAFVEEMIERTRPYWERNVEELRTHARSLELEELKPWDVLFVEESLRKERHGIDDEHLRPYFPLDQVLDGLFRLARRLFGVTVSEREIEEVWHPDVRFYELHGPEGTLRGAFYTDWFPRKEKEQGAWMDDFVTGGPRPDGSFAPHLAFIGGNFTPPHGEGPPLLTHREVQILFHEFGHLLHHCTCTVPVAGRSGLQVPWDWVEVPSQLLENWSWERESLELFARHHETGDPLPDEVRERMAAARSFLGAWRQMRQLGYGRVDLALHREFAPDPDGDVLDFVERCLLPLTPGPAFARSHRLTSFTHFVSSGYAAGYYSYLWSEVLEADAFTRFQEEGVLNPETGRALLGAILSRGDGEDPRDLFREFMGRDPDPSALLERNLGPGPAPSRPSTEG